jgi:hypothetical protein
MLMFVFSLPDRNRSRMYRVFFLALSAIVTSTACSGKIRDATEIQDPFPQGPKVVLWAWERPENLMFLKERPIGVAFLAETIVLESDSMKLFPRLQPLRIPEETFRIAVVRIETSRDHPPNLDSGRSARVAAEIAQTGALPGIAGVQVDFDAGASERRFYREMLQDLRRRLPQSVRLTITALASWCIFDTWIFDLPVDEAVPMLFRMGADDRRVRMYLESGRDFRLGLCRCSSGISTDELLPAMPAGRRLYVFHPKPWTEHSLDGMLTEVSPWN